MCGGSSVSSAMPGFWMISSGLAELEKNGKFLSVPVGNSMEPLLKSKENVVEIVKADHPLRKYDITLHVREDGTSVLHRVMKVRKDSYVICGDNCITPETVPFGQVAGVAVRFYRKGKWVSVSDPGYRLYVHVWCGLFPLRKYLLKCHKRIQDFGRKGR